MCDTFLTCWSLNLLFWTINFKKFTNSKTSCNCCWAAGTWIFVSRSLNRPSIGDSTSSVYLYIEEVEFFLCLACWAADWWRFGCLWLNRGYLTKYYEISMLTFVTHSRAFHMNIINAPLEYQQLFYGINCQIMFKRVTALLLLEVHLIASNDLDTVAPGWSLVCCYLGQVTLLVHSLPRGTWHIWIVQVSPGGDM